MVYRFLDFELDASLKELRQSGAPCAIEPQVFDLLLFLIENRDRIVSHDDLIENVWRGRIIADATIASRIRAVRAALGDTGTEQRIIQTLPKRGFRFVASVADPQQEANWGTPSDPGSGAAQDAANDRPSISILPFRNLSSDPEQAFFADGIVEDLTTALSRFSWLFVIARNSSFSFKGKELEIGQIATDLGVRYLVEGSVRSSASRLRVAVHLIDAENERHIWAETYDRPTGDLFDIQDEITQAITGVLVPILGNAERERSFRKVRPNLGAWEAYQRGLAHYYKPYTDQDNLEAYRLFSKAIAVDPTFPDAHAMLAMLGVYAFNTGQSAYADPNEDILLGAKQAAERAVQLDESNALAHVALGRALDLLGDRETAIIEGLAAVNLNPNFAFAHHELAMIYCHANRLAEAMPYLDKAIQLSPTDPARWNFHYIKSSAQFGLGHYEEAISEAREAARLRPPAFWPYLVQAASYAALDRMEDARGAISDVLSRNSDCTCSFMYDLIRKVDAGRHYYRIAEACKKAGLPK